MRPADPRTSSTRAMAAAHENWSGADDGEDPGAAAVVAAGAEAGGAGAGGSDCRHEKTHAAAKTPANVTHPRPWRIYPPSTTPFALSKMRAIRAGWPAFVRPSEL